jgi:hypothetical protein
MSRWLAVLLFGGVLVAAEPTRFTFDGDNPGRPPAGFVFTVSANDAPGVWVVREDDAPGRGRVLVQTSADGRGSRFPMAVVEGVVAADVDVSVKLKPMAGREDQAGGLVWRYQDPGHYYVVRVNALEGNVVLYKVAAGRRVDLPLKGEGRTYGKKAVIPTGQWGDLRVVADGPRFEVFWNGTRLFDVEDATFSQPGRVGLWTKADSVTAFDDLTVVTR